MARPKDESMRQGILEAAFHMFGERGFGATTVKDLARSLNISPGSIYTYFAGKEDLFRCTVEEGWQGGLFPVAVPLLAGPAVVAAAVAYASLEGTGETAVTFAAVIAATAGVAWFAGTRPLAAYGALARLTGALLVVLAAGLIVDGVHDI